MAFATPGFRAHQRQAAAARHPATCATVAEMKEVDVGVWLTSGYAIFLLLGAYGVDLMARRTALRTDDRQTGSFTYHQDHDAWVCPEDQWLWPQSFDPENRVMRYRASPTVCNGCPVKITCTTSNTGREISRNIDPWPHSEAGRFHRGMACAVTVLALVLPLLTMIGRSALEILVLAVVCVLVALGSWPLWSHLRHTPTGFPVETATGVVAVVAEPAPADGIDRFTTRWGGFEAPAQEGQSPKYGRNRLPRS